MTTWTREVIGRQVYLNTQDAVYEILTKTPEDILCKSKDAVKIDMMIKEAENSEPDEQYNVLLVPYRNVKTGIVINPHSNNHTRNVSLAVAFIAADRQDWTRFIPVGLKARALAQKKQREQEVVRRQNAPYARNKKHNRSESRDGGSSLSSDESNAGDDEFIACSDAEEESCDDESSDAEESETGEERDFDSDEDVQDKLYAYDRKTKRFVKPSTDDKQFFDDEFAAQPTKSFAIDAFNASSAATEQIMQRVAKIKQEQQQQQLETLPSDRKRRQAASLNDPECEANLSELTQHYQATGGNAENFDVNRQRDAAKQRALGLVVAASKAAPLLEPPSHVGNNVLDRFAPEPKQKQEQRQKATAGKNNNIPQFSVAQLIEVGSKMPLPPSMRKKTQPDSKDATKTTTTTAASTAAAAHTMAPKGSENAKATVQQLIEQLRFVRRKQLELMQMTEKLEDICLALK